MSEFTPLPYKLVELIVSDDIIKTGRSIHNDITRIVDDYGVIEPATRRRAIELSVLCRKADLVPRGGKTTLQALTAYALERYLPKSHHLRLGPWDAAVLSPAQVQYAALDAWASLRVYQAVDTMVRPGDAIDEPHVGLVVEVRLSPRSKTVIARGTIVDHPEPKLGDLRINRATHCVVEISVVEVPAAILARHQKPLSSFGTGPFRAIVQKKALRSSIPLPIAASLQRLTEQRAMPNAATLIDLADHLSLAAEDNEETGASTLDDIFADFDEEMPLPSPTDSDGLQEFQADGTHWIRYVLDDPYHIMARIRCSRLHGAALQFAWAFRDALFVPDPVIKQRLVDFFISKGTTFERVMASNSAWINAHLPRRIPPAHRLFPVLRQLFDEYKDLVDANTNGTLFDDVCRRKAEGILTDVLSGYVSDPPGIELYVAIGTDMHGLMLYRCLRGTNSVEGGVHQNIIRMFQSFNASPQLAVGLLTEYVLRHNLTVTCRNLTGKAFDDHYDIWQTSNIISLYHKLDMDLPERYHGRLNLNDYADSDEAMFIAPLPADVMEKYDIQPWVDMPNQRLSQTQWLARRQGTKFPTMPVHTVAEKSVYRAIIPSETGAFDAQLKALEFNQKVNQSGEDPELFYKLPDHLLAYSTVARKADNARRTLAASAHVRRVDEYSTSHARTSTIAPPLSRPMQTPSRVSIATPRVQITAPPLQTVPPTPVTAVMPTPPATAPVFPGPDAAPSPGASEEASVVPDDAPTSNKKQRHCKVCKQHNRPLDEQASCKGRGKRSSCPHYRG